MTGLEVLASLFPIVVDAGKALVNKYITPDQFKPANIGEYVQVRNLDLEWFKAVSGAGGSNPTYQWVEAVKQLMRPTVGIIVLGAWAALHLIALAKPELRGNLDAVDSFAATIGFYLFGDRTLFYTKKAAK